MCRDMIGKNAFVGLPGVASSLVDVILPMMGNVFYKESPSCVGMCSTNMFLLGLPRVASVLL